MPVQRFCFYNGKGFPGLIAEFFRQTRKMAEIAAGGLRDKTGPYREEKVKMRRSCGMEIFSRQEISMPGKYFSCPENAGKRL